ncbi:MAG: hypothetical protein KDA48_06415 [Amphiplicatus sp.]|nr:hypothetical protein [Amphiplicatus sp.]HRX37920.1 hypothetical protein [Parvularculaceae bacterium]
MPALVFEFNVPHRGEPIKNRERIVNKKALIAASVLVAFGFANAQAGGDDSLAACNEFAANNGVSAEPCACIADAVSADAALKAEQLALVTMADYEAASPALHAAIDPCIQE